jgi:DNA-binding CsgD family transcriptional regulator
MTPKFETLKTNHRAMGEKHQCMVEHDDYDMLGTSIRDLELCSKLANAALSVYDMHRHQFLFRSNSDDHHCEHPVFAWRAGVDHNTFHETIHANDLPQVLEANLEAYDALEALPPNEKHEKILCCLFRTKNGRGGYKLLFYRIAVFRLDRNNNIWLLLIHSTMLTDCASHNAPCGYYFGSFSFMGDKLQLTCNKVSVNLLSKREYEVLCLIVAGYENYQITEMLGIKLNTLNEHRRHLEQHFRAKDMSQVIVFATRLGIV